MRAESNLGGLLGKAARLMSNTLNARLKALGLTAQQWSLMAELSHKGGRNQTELAEALLKGKASVGSLIDYLEKKNCIARLPSPNDRRETIIALTPTGHALFESAIPEAKGVIRTANNGVSPEDLATTQKVLQQIIHNLEDSK